MPAGAGVATQGMTGVVGGGEGFGGGVAIDVDLCNIKFKKIKNNITPNNPQSINRSGISTMILIIPPMIKQIPINIK
ncbi:MAG: hypothetical protein WA055_06055 [Candidatus Moraniibacteriota bacterium]